MTDDLDWAGQEAWLRAKLGEIDGVAFETLFGEIAKVARADNFQATIPIDSSSGLKCDGFRRSAGAVFQPYGLCYDQAKVDHALIKIDEDLWGAHSHWGAEMRSWPLLPNAVWHRTGGPHG